MTRRCCGRSRQLPPPVPPAGGGGRRRARRVGARAPVGVESRGAGGRAAPPTRARRGARGRAGGGAVPERPRALGVDGVRGRRSNSPSPRSSRATHAGTRRARARSAPARGGAPRAAGAHARRSGRRCRARRAAAGAPRGAPGRAHRRLRAVRGHRPRALPAPRADGRRGGAHRARRARGGRHAHPPGGARAILAAAERRRAAAPARPDRSAAHHGPVERGTRSQRRVDRGASRSALDAGAARAARRPFAPPRRAARADARPRLRAAGGRRGAARGRAATTREARGDGARDRDWRGRCFRRSARRWSRSRPPRDSGRKCTGSCAVGARESIQRGVDGAGHRDRPRGGARRRSSSRASQGRVVLAGAVGDDDPSDDPATLLPALMLASRAAAVRRHPRRSSSARCATPSSGSRGARPRRAAGGASVFRAPARRAALQRIAAITGRATASPARRSSRRSRRRRGAWSRRPSGSAPSGSSTRSRGRRSRTRRGSGRCGSSARSTPARAMRRRGQRDDRHLTLIVVDRHRRRRRRPRRAVAPARRLDDYSWMWLNPFPIIWRSEPVRIELPPDSAAALDRVRERLPGWSLSTVVPRGRDRPRHRIARPTQALPSASPQRLRAAARRQGPRRGWHARARRRVPRFLADADLPLALVRLRRSCSSRSSSSPRSCRTRPAPPRRYAGRLARRRGLRERRQPRRLHGRTAAALPHRPRHLRDQRTPLGGGQARISSSSCRTSWHRARTDDPARAAVALARHAGAPRRAGAAALHAARGLRPTSRSIAVEIRIPDAPDTLRLGMATHDEYDDRYWRYVRDLRAESGGAPRRRRRARTVRSGASTGARGDVTVRYRIAPPAGVARARTISRGSRTWVRWAGSSAGSIASCTSRIA